MSIAATGAVSFSDLRTEFVGGSSAISYSDLYRGGSNIRTKASDNSGTNLAASVPTSGTINMSNFRGSAKGFRFTFSSGAVDQSADALFGADYGVAYPKEIVINSGVELGATTTSEEALEIPVNAAGSITITNNGTLTGAGGAAGADGGDAFEAAVPVTLINNGTIRAGGGGGGTGGAGSFQQTTSASHSNGIQNNTSYGNRGGYTNGNQTSFNVYGPGDGNIHQTFSGTITFASSVTVSRTSANVVNTSYDYSRFNGSNSGGTYSAGTYSINGSTAYSHVRFYWTFSTTGLVTYNFGNRSAYNYSSTTTVSSTGGAGGVGQGYNQTAGTGAAGGTNAGNGADGASYGASGSAGANGTVSNGTSGGASGNYLRGLSFITFTNNGTVQGTTV